MARPGNTGRRAVALAAVVVAVAAARPARGASVQVEGSVVLGRTESVPVLIRVDEPPGAEEQPLRLAVNVGAFSEPRRLGPGSYRAIYVPPPTRFPQVALVAVWRETGPDAAIDFVRIPLFGTTRVEASASPGALARARVGVGEFGPVRADRRGRIEIPIVVEPGIHECDVSFEERGHAPTTRRVRLEVPPYNRLTAALVPHAVVADGRSRVRLDVLYDLGGADVPPQRIQVKASVGRVSLLGASRGRYSYEYVPPSGTGASSVSFSVSVEGDPQAAAAARLALGLPPPARVLVTAPPKSVAAGSGAAGAVTALVLDAAGMGLPGLDVSGTANGEPLAPAVDRGAGRYELAYRAPAIYPPGGLVQLQVTASDRAGARASGGANWQLDAAPVPSAVAARLVPSPVPADGRTEARLTLDLRDAAGMPLPGAQFIAVASHGTLGKIRDLGGGRYEASYVAPASLPEGEAVVRVVDGSGAFERSLPVPLRHASRRLLLGLAGGYALSPGDAAGPRAWAGAWLPFRLGGASCGAGVSASYGTAERSVRDASGTLESVTRASFAPVALKLGYEVLAGRRASLTLGAGAVAAWARFESSLASGWEAGWAPGWMAFAAAGWAVGPGQAFVEISHAAAAVETDRYRIDPGGPSVAAGYRLGIF